MLHRRLARRMERVVRDVVDGAYDPAAVVSEVEHVDARRRLLERPEVGAPTGERVRDEDAVDPAVKDRERCLPGLCDDAFERGKDAVERFAERLTAEKALVLLADRQ